MADERKNNKSTFFWWKTEQSDISNQVENYTTLGFLHSYRKISSLFICVSSLITIAFALGMSDQANLIGALIFVALAIPVYRGSKFFTIIAMILWTLAKFTSVFLAIFVMINDRGSAIPIISHLTFWTIGMSMLFNTYKVEQQKEVKTKKQQEPTTIHTTQQKTKHPIISTVLQVVGVIAIIFVAINSFPTFLHIFNTQKNEVAQENKNTILPSPTSSNWKSIYLHKDKFKISLPDTPSQYNQSIALNNKKIDLDTYVSTSSSNTTYTVSYSDLGNLYELKYEKDCESDNTFCEFLKHRDEVLKRRSPEMKKDIYDTYFAFQKGSREISNVSDSFNGSDSYDFLWKNSNNSTFTKGKMIIIDAKDLYILTAENESETFIDFETFVNSWKPFGELSQ